MKNGNVRGLGVFGRTVTALLLGTSLLAGLVTSPTQVAADDVIVRDHRPKDAWLEIVVNKIIIHDDQDGFLKGAGEMHFQVRIGQLNCNNGPVWGDCLGFLVKSADIAFSADTGDTKVLNRVVPQMGDLLSTSLDDDAGVTMHPGTTYGVEVTGKEGDDDSADDNMGETHLILTDPDWSIGTHSIRGQGAAYTVELEVRRVALADLTPRSIKVVNRSSLKPEREWKEICAMVANIGPKEAPGYKVNFTLDGAPYMRDAGYNYPGEVDEVCAEVPDPALGEHILTAVIQGVPEMDLSNNEMRSTYTRTILDDIRIDTAQTGGVLETSKTDPAPAGGSTQTSGNAQTSSGQVGTAPTGGAPVSKETAPSGTTATAIDLAIIDIRVKGSCEEGKNDVVVTVKNQGTATVRDLVVTLEVDGDDGKDKSLNSLDAGKDTTVEFGDVQLKKGNHKLTASVAPKGSDKDKAEETETVNCKDN